MKKLLVQQQSPNTSSPRSFHSVVPGGLPLSSRTLTFTARLIRAHRRTIGSRWRVLDPGAQALLTLAYLYQGHTYEQLAPGFGISYALNQHTVSPTNGHREHR
ncbi:transposase family protein [Glycomyces rhizosphaerae]|uniref:Transposase family protein n=1 Tax=Glycomyces rhizosphaerae TaxID=2054422 RepID=A0ABV7Q763_9ACTN